MPGGRKRSRSELIELYDFHRRALVASAAAYDAGEKLEALRMATSVSTLVHDGGRNNVSLLTQLGLRAGAWFMATGQPTDPRNLMRQVPLTFTRIRTTPSGPIASIEPKLDDFDVQPRMIRFTHWWNDEGIFLDGSLRLTRKNLVFNLRSREGGAHVDATQDDPNYLRMAYEAITTPRLLSSLGGKEDNSPILGAELASMRQITFELLKSLEQLPVPSNEP